MADGDDGVGGSGVSGIRGSNSVVESQPSKLLVAGSIPVSRSRMLSGLLFDWYRIRSRDNWCEPM